VCTGRGRRSNHAGRGGPCRSCCFLSRVCLLGRSSRPDVFVVVFAEMAGERRILSPQERLVQGYAGKRKAAEAPAPPSKRSTPASKTAVGTSSAVPSAPRGTPPASGGNRGAQLSVPREPQTVARAGSHAGASGQVAAPPSSVTGSRHGGSPPLPPSAFSSAHLFELGKRCHSPEMPVVESFHPGLGYLGKVCTISFSLPLVF
jgi:hypothetical protein